MFTPRSAATMCTTTLMQPARLESTSPTGLAQRYCRRRTLVHRGKGESANCHHEFAGRLGVPRDGKSQRRGGHAFSALRRPTGPYSPRAPSTGVRPTRSLGRSSLAPCGSAHNAEASPRKVPSPPRRQRPWSVRSIHPSILWETPGLGRRQRARLLQTRAVNTPFTTTQEGSCAASTPGHRRNDNKCSVRKSPRAALRSGCPSGTCPTVLVERPPFR